MKGGDGRRKRTRKVKEQTLYFLLKSTVLERLWKAQINSKKLGADRHDLETWQEIILLAKLLSKKEGGEEQTHASPAALCCYSSPVPHHSFGEDSGNGPCHSRHGSRARLWVTAAHQCSAQPHRAWCMLRNIQLMLEHNLLNFYEIKRCQLQGCILLPFVPRSMPGIWQCMCCLQLRFTNMQREPPRSWQWQGKDRTKAIYSPNQNGAGSCASPHLLTVTVHYKYGSFNSLEITKMSDLTLSLSKPLRNVSKLFLL